MLAPTSKLATFFLAGLYALVAFFGHAMHTDCHSGCNTVAEAQGCCSGCCHQHATITTCSSSDNHSAIAKSDSDAIAHTDCVACKLLSQMSHGFQLDNSDAGYWFNTDFPPIVSEQIAESDSVTLFDARGPPVLV